VPQGETIMHLRSVELQMPNRAAAVDFLKEPWGLVDAGTRGATTSQRGTLPLHYVVAVAERPARPVVSATITGPRKEVDST